MTQQIIDTGLVANDGTGESLRNAFTAVNNNFANVWAAGPVDTQVIIYSNVVSTNVTNLDLRLAGNGIGTITVESTMVPSIDRVYDLGTPTKQYDSVYAQYYFGNGAFLTGISGGNVAASNSFSTISANGVNIVAASATDTLTLVSGNNVVILGNSATDTVSISLVNNPVFSGNITAGGNIIGSNVNTANLSLSGNVVSALAVSGNVTAPYFFGNGSQLTGVVTSLGGNLAANINTGIYNLFSSNGAVNIDDTLSVTGTVITTGGLVTPGAIATTANVTANYFIGDGSQLTNLPAGNYSNANVASFLPTYTGNVAANNFIGNGAALTSIVGANIVGTVANATYALNANSATFATNAGQSNYAIVANSVAGANVSGTVANATYALNANTSNNTNQANVANVANSVAGANVSGTVANATYALNANAATYATTAVNSAQSNYANIANSVTGANVIGIVANAAYAITASSADTANTAGLAQFVTANAQANITSVGVLTSLSATGNITAPYFIGNGSQLTGVVKSLAGNLAGNIDTLEFSINSSNGEVRFGNSISVIGNAIITNDLIVGDQIATTGNITTAANVYAENFIGNVYGNVFANILVPGGNTDVIFNTNGEADATSGLRFNKVANVLTVGGNVSAVGNIAGNYILGNGSQLIGLPALYGNANVADFLPIYTGNLVSLGGNVTTTANVNANNFIGNTASIVGNITTSANVIAQYFVGNFAGNISGNLTVPGANTQVIFNTNGSADATAGFTFDKISNAVVVSGNVTANYFIGNGSQLTGIDATSIQNGNSNVKAYANSNVAVTVAGTSNVAVVTTNGINIAGTVSTTGNIQTAAQVVATGNITGSNIGTSGTTSTANFVITGEIAGNLIPTANITYNLGDADSRWNDLYLSGNSIYIDSQIISANADGLSLSNTAFMTSLSVSGNAVAGNLNTTGQVSATGNITGGNIITPGQLTVTGNTTILGNLLVDGNVTYINIENLNVEDPIIGLGRGPNNTPLTANDGRDRGEQLWYYSTAENSGFIGYQNSSGKLIGATNVSITNEVVTVNNFGNIVLGNIEGATASLTGNVTANYFIGNGSQLTGIDATSIQNGNSNVKVYANANVTTTVAGVANVLVIANTGAYVTGIVSVSGNITGSNINTAGSLAADTITSYAANANVSLVPNGTGIVTIDDSNGGSTGIQLGTPTAGTLVSNAVTLTTSTSVTNGIAQLNLILGKLVPPSPPNFPNATTIALSGIATYRMANIVQVDNTPGANRAVAAGTSVANVLRVATYATNTISTVGPGDSGIVTAVRNGANVGNVTFNTGASPTANGTYGGNLVITNNYDYHVANASIAAGFWYVFSAAVSGTSALAGWNELYIADSVTGNTNTTVWYYDNSSPSAPSFSSTTMAPPGSANLLYSSTIPHYTNNNNFTIGFNVANVSGNTYPTSNTLASGSAGGAFAAPSSINYSASNIGSNVLNSFASASANTTVSVTTGFGGSSTGPSMSVNNSYSTGTLTLTAALANTVLWKSGTATAVDEANVVIGSTIGTGSGNAFRIVNPGSGNTPAYTSNAAAFNSQTSTLETYDSTVVGSGSAGVLKHDQTNYSTGYLPAGPNLSAGRSGTQYFTFKFVRTAVSKFDIKYTGTIAGMWVALPGSVIDSSSGANGWIDMSVAYGGAGYPGVTAPGNGSDGCAVGGVVTLNSAVTNSSKTCTFGTVSSSSTATNEIYVRIALTSGQSVTALTLQTASN